MTAENSGDRSRSPAVTRAAAILMTLAEDPRRSLGPSELSRRVDVPKATVLNICSALIEAQLLRQTKHGYSLGRRLAELGKAYLASVEEVEEFYLLCRQLFGEAEQTVQMAVLGDGPNVVYLARHDGREPLHLGLASEIGRSVPAQCTAAGKALLAALTPRQLDRQLAGWPLRGLTEKSITDEQALFNELALTRERGYAVDNEEVVPGLYCFGRHVATPHREDGLLAVSFTFRAHGRTDEHRAQAVAGLAHFAATFGAAIGGRDDQNKP
ncbi:IclR family transcriptional regulator [Rhizomonospora bruguierae]|uniref:IclR family transcriptional regulator n=1 Tax=Rhizomonospora bruguierae TaxID=1581705 RepID=UPI001BCF059A|nr:IclR family transcriptional regulator C-terminal domain-containing protein [Micromonospora sp. NBRC 107566]